MDYPVENVLLTQPQLEVLGKVFKFADVESSGYVDAATMATLAVQILGTELSEAEKDAIVMKSESRAENGLVSFHQFIRIIRETMVSTTHWGKLKTQLEGPVGFDTIQEQLQRKSLKRGFEFNIMVVGASGLGKSTLVNTLFRSKLSRRSCTSDCPPISKTIEVASVSHVIEEKNVNFKLTITDTPGFGDQVNNSDCWTPLVRHIQGQYQRYLDEENHVMRRPKIPDCRVHCCLYFVSPTGHRLRPIDIECMKQLHKVVNIVPILAKADTLTLEEREAFKKRVREDIDAQNIIIYPFLHNELDEVEVKAANKIRDQLPYAVVGSDTYVSVGGKQILGRKNKWGVVEVENKLHCEFSLLRDMLIRTHLQDLIDVTNFIHYENYRRSRMGGEIQQQNHYHRRPSIDNLQTSESKL